MSKKTVLCNGCDVEFHKETSEVNRRRKRDPNCNFYCSRECYDVSGNRSKNLKHHLGVPNLGNLRRGSNKDPFSPFRYFMRKANSRKYETDLDLPYLKALWEKQGGFCPLTGTKMGLPESGREWERDKGNPWKPSLDRIDSSKGYFKGNVRYIVCIANLCKNSWSDDVVVEFCQRVSRVGSDLGQV